VRGRDATDLKKSRTKSRLRGRGEGRWKGRHDEGARRGRPPPLLPSPPLLLARRCLLSLSQAHDPPPLPHPSFRSTRGRDDHSELLHTISRARAHPRAFLGLHKFARNAAPRPATGGGAPVKPNLSFRPAPLFLRRARARARKVRYLVQVVATLLPVARVGRRAGPAKPSWPTPLRPHRCCRRRRSRSRSNSKSSSSSSSSNSSNNSSARSPCSSCGGATASSRAAAVRLARCWRELRARPWQRSPQKARTAAMATTTTPRRQQQHPHLARRARALLPRDSRRRVPLPSPLPLLLLPTLPPLPVFSPALCSGHLHLASAAAHGHRHP